MPRILAFDVNETLLDLSALDEPFARAFGDASVRGEWFSQMLQLAFVGGLTGSYVDFGSAQQAALRMVAEVHGVDLPDDLPEEIANRMRSLPAHPDADAALGRLAEAGLTLAALTNSTLEVARAQLASAGLAGRFDAVHSGDEVQALKPRPEAYALVSDHYGVANADVRLVAAHAWDISGALAAGCAAAFVARPGKVLSPLGPQPDVTGDDLHAVADGILAADG
jgi:2-haloacid dehalogenase